MGLHIAAFEKFVHGVFIVNGAVFGDLIGGPAKIYEARAEAVF